MITYEEGPRHLFCMCKGSVVPKAFFLALPSTILACLLVKLDTWSDGGVSDAGLPQVASSMAWSAVTATIGLTLAFRTRQALGRFWEGTGLMHQMQGEWFDAVSNLMCFSRDALDTMPDFVHDFRHTLVRLMSLMHGSALDEICGNPEGGQFEVLDLRGLDMTTLQFLRDCSESHNFNKVEALMHMIQVLVTHYHSIGVLNTPAPILSRVYQTLSRGLVNFLNAKKIRDTMFPFPFAQLCAILIAMHAAITPVMMSQVVGHPFWAAVVTFPAIFGFLCLNLTANELEMPFGTDQNDLPLEHFQEEMNRSLLLLIHHKADILPGIAGCAISDFNELRTFSRATCRRGSVVIANMSTSRSIARASFFSDTSDSEPSTHGRAIIGPSIVSDDSNGPPWQLGDEDRSATLERSTEDDNGDGEPGPLPFTKDAGMTSTAGLFSTDVTSFFCKGKEEWPPTSGQRPLPATPLIGPPRSPEDKAAAAAAEQALRQQTDLQIHELARISESLQEIVNSLPPAMQSMTTALKACADLPDSLIHYSKTLRRIAALPRCSQQWDSEDSLPAHLSPSSPTSAARSPTAAAAARLPTAAARRRWTRERGGGGGGEDESGEDMGMMNTVL